jgi:CheY-like chemotaxis protein
MSARALVVDDSRSARAFLTRELERHELSVDGVESAEQAIDYLTRLRPDVIFMDHLMPGMDGFQAVQAIKNNPRTATIPIMMYTSQEGELYLSQARALGAIGVLPKQIKHADVAEALEQLHLLHPTGAVAAGAAAASSSAPPSAPLTPFGNDSLYDIKRERRGPRRPDLPALPPNLRSILEAMFAHHNNEMRRFVVDHMESQADRIIGDMRLLLQDQPAAAAQFPRRMQPVRWGLWLGVAGVLVASLFALQWFRERTASEQLGAQLAQSQQLLQSVQQNLSSLQAAEAAAAASAGAPVGETGGIGGTDQTASVEPVPFGEMPLSGARLDQVASLLSRLNAQGFEGTLQVRSFPGRFCMVNGASGQPVLAQESTPYSKCEQIGNPREDNGSAAQRESIAFANMIATAQRNSGGRIDVQIAAGGADEFQTPYPPISEALLAGEWNRVASANNRVELHWVARH